MRLFVLLSVCAFAFAGEAAHAAPPAPAPVSAPDWNGLYAGFDIGVAANSTSHKTSSTFTPYAFDTFTHVGNYATGIGFHLGYNYQLPGPFVVGVEGSLDLPNGQYREFGPTQDFLMKLDTVYTVAGRAGVLVTPRTLVYGKIGASQMALEGIDGFGTNFQQTVGATTYGIGVEGLITDNILLRVEATDTKANSDVVLNSGFDAYRPEVLQVKAGASVKIDPLPNLRSKDTAWTWWKPVTRSWTGVFAGGGVGIDSGRTDYFSTTFGDFGPYTDTGTTYGVFAGADLQLPNWIAVLPTVVIGVQYANDWMHAAFDTSAGTGLVAPDYHFATISRVSAVTGRVGLLVTPSVLAYFRGGPAWMRFTAEPGYFNAINAASGAGTSTLNATQFGLGIETFLTDHLALRVEALNTTSRDEVVLNGILPADTRLSPSVTTGTVSLLAKF